MSWDSVAAISFFIGLFAPPVWIFTIFCLWMEYRHEKKVETRAIAHSASPTIENSHPGKCPACGSQDWSRGDLRIVPAQGIRSHQFPMEGMAAVAVFHCNNCMSYGRYGRSYTQREDGWILLDMYMGGW